MSITILGLDTEELCKLAFGEGEPDYRGKQLAEWVYQRGAPSFNQMTSLPTRLRAKLENKYAIGRSRIAAIQHSQDGAIKLLLETYDGAKVETVGLPYPDRLSCCVSTQVGCPVGCLFCATGQSGFNRNLTAGEIVDQVLAVREVMHSHPLPGEVSSRRLDHVTFMGMGEPLLNYAATIKALHLLNREAGIAMRNLTLSTAGYVPAMGQLAREKLQVTLAVSLHSPHDNQRRRLVPGLSRWSVEEIIDAANNYVKETGRRFTIEYCLLDGVNDSVIEAQKLVKLLHGLNCHVNLIPYNPVSSLPFRPSRVKAVQVFRAILEKGNMAVTQRVQRGSDIDAACGQLRQRISCIPLDPGLIKV